MEETKAQIYWIHIGIVWALVGFILLTDGYLFPIKFNEGWFYSYQTLLAGLLAFGGGTFVLVAVKKQIKASIKEKWLHDFRNDIAAFITATSMINDLFKEGYDHQIHIIKLQRMLEAPYDPPKKSELEKEIKDTIKKEEQCFADFKKNMEIAGLYQIKIQLFLNKKILEHKELDDRLSEWSELSREWESSLTKEQNENLEVLKKANTMKTLIVECAQAICDYEIANIK